MTCFVVEIKEITSVFQNIDLQGQSLGINNFLLHFHLRVVTGTTISLFKDTNRSTMDEKGNIYSKDMLFQSD